MDNNTRIPPGFKYKDVFLKGRPVHDSSDSFSSRHPPMPAERWAKIFAPFDALRGFREAISSRNKAAESQSRPAQKPEHPEYVNLQDRIHH